MTLADQVGERQRIKTAQQIDSDLGADGLDADFAGQRNPYGYGCPR